MLKHYKIKVHGQVQGVYFRMHAKQAADILGITGWVQNENEGYVSIEAEGEEKSLNHFIEWCKEGSPDAKVDKVETQEDAVGNLKDFLIVN